MPFNEKKNDASNRRDFLKKAAALSLGAAVGGAAFTKAETVLAKSSFPQSPVPRRTFGRSGIKVSTLSMGGMYDILNNRLMLAKALEWGIDYWDTAESYGGGRSEEGIGRWFAKKPDSRKQVFLVTKLSPRRSGDYTKRLEACLKRLHTDYVDLFFVHAISDIDEMTPELEKWSKEMKRAGKIRLFGFSTHSNMEECLEGAAKLPWIDGIMFTYNFRLMNEPRMKAAVAACHRAGIGLTAMKTQGGGSVKSNPQSEMDMAGRFMEEGFTPEQAKMMAVWQDKRIASICSQMPNLTIMGANAVAVLNQKRLSAVDRVLLDQYAKATGCDYCAGCGRICTQAMNDSVPINDIMRCLMYARAYQDLSLAEATFKALPPETGSLLGQLDFKKAEAKCPRKLPITRMMNEAKRLFA
ncbi:MAG: aldo/keto reductase [Deltaproteobacteria bacterium]|jgi:predicted aldo/keto reductase-like oxidoreductase